MTRVFISYAAEDRDTVTALIRELESRGVQVVRDVAGVGPSTPMKITVRENIQRADFVIPIVSRSLLEAPPDSAGLQLIATIEELYAGPSAPRIIPVILHSTEIRGTSPSTFAWMRGLHAVEFHADWTTGVNQLLRALGVGSAPQNRWLFFDDVGMEYVKSDDALSKLLGEVDHSPVEKLRLHIHRGNASAPEIQLFLESLEDLYRALGGSGLQIEVEPEGRA